MERRKFTIILLPLAEGGYEAHFPRYPNCFVWGDTIDEALERARDAVVNYLEGLAEQGLDLDLQFAHVPHVVVGELDVEVPGHLMKIAKAEEQYEAISNPAH